MTVTYVGESLKNKYSGLSTDTKPTTAAVTAGDEFYETDTRDRYEYDGNSWVQRRHNGAEYVIHYIAGTTHRREENALDATVVEIDFSATPISALSVKVANEAATTPDLNSMAICFDAPNTAVATTWLTAGDSRAADSQREIVTPKDGFVDYFFNSSTVSKVHIKRDLGSDALRVILTGVE